jgi:hypothetical protein
MVRRTLRNYIAIKAPIWYRNRLSRIKKSIPTLSFASQLKSSVQEIGDFYCAEYGDQVADILSGKIVLHGRSVDFKSIDRIDWKIRSKRYNISTMCCSRIPSLLVDAKF